MSCLPRTLAHSLQEEPVQVDEFESATKMLLHICLQVEAILLRVQRCHRVDLLFRLLSLPSLFGLFESQHLQGARRAHRVAQAEGAATAVAQDHRARGQVPRLQLLRRAHRPTRQRAEADGKVGIVSRDEVDGGNRAPMAALQAATERGPAQGRGGTGRGNNVERN